jgi:exopolysaccharide biosynthesis polyprenyl glycosylphosphotransferase
MGRNMFYGGKLLSRRPTQVFVGFDFQDSRHASWADDGAAAGHLHSLPTLFDSKSLYIRENLFRTASSALLTFCRQSHRYATALGALITFELFRPPLNGFVRVIKRVFDILVSSAGLIFLTPILVVVAAVIKWDSAGPVLFRHIRHGYNNEAISVLKFRTMTTVESGYAFTQARENDRRVTRVGRILRRTNVDELPQLLNVLVGDMSIVGPRPHPVAMNDHFQQYILPLARRHNVKPGITGWAQVNGCRGETDTLEKMQRRIEHDLYYIDNWSFLLDIKIVLLTLFSRSAYVNAF